MARVSFRCWLGPLNPFTRRCHPELSSRPASQGDFPMPPKNRTYSVYKGELQGTVVYIGTTIQKPSDRFRWHKHNGKNLTFTVLHQFDNPEDMLIKEYDLIKSLSPRLNKITHRKQNLNVRLDAAAIDSRRGDKEWCQSCMKRRVNKGYKTCMWC